VNEAEPLAQNHQIDLVNVACTSAKRKECAVSEFIPALVQSKMFRIR